MIRINLLTEKRNKKRVKGPGFFVIAAAANLAALLVVGVAVFVLKSGVSQLKVRSEANATTINELSRKINEVKKYEKLNKELEQRSAIIETLRKNQSVPVRVLDDLSGVVPQGVWLNSLAYKSDGVAVEGTAFTNIDIVTFVDNLKKLGSAADVYLEESRETDVNKVKVYRFKLNFKVKG